MAAVKQEAGTGDAAPAEPISLSIVVRDQTGFEVIFKVKPHTKFERVFAGYYDKKHVPAGTMKFLFDGQRVQETQTPKELDMVDGDVIDALVEQIGGRALA